MTDDFVPVFGEGEDRPLEGFHAVERFMAQRAAGEDAEPNFDLIEPAPMSRGEDELDPRMAAEPSSSVFTGPGADVVSDDDEAPTPVEMGEVVEERKAQTVSSGRASPRRRRAPS